jgi:Ca2+/Na+ antiporter
MLILMIISILFSFYLLAEICDKYFVSSLEKISKNIGLSSEAAGATLMAVGSSAPELFVSMIALFKPGEEAM